MSEEIFYDKLIRDKIPEIIDAAGKEYEIHTAEDGEYLEKLLDKVLTLLKRFEIIMYTYPYIPLQSEHKSAFYLYQYQIFLISQLHLLLNRLNKLKLK